MYSSYFEKSIMTTVNSVQQTKYNTRPHLNQEYYQGQYIKSLGHLNIPFVRFLCQIRFFLTGEV